jgi:ribosome-associated translation inhibitor RaiA
VWISDRGGELLAQRPTLVTNFKDLSKDETVRDAIEKRCQHLAEEFDEILRIEITLTADGVGFTAHGHVTGRQIDVATHAAATEMLPAAEKLLTKVGRQLRRAHDKRIFARRREAQRKSPKRKTS